MTNPKLLFILAAITAFTSSLGCDGEPSESSSNEVSALMFVDGEPIYSLDEIPADEDVLLDLVDEIEDSADESSNEDIQHRAACVADCGGSMMSVSGSECSCVDNRGCAVKDGGHVYTWRCVQM